MNIKQKNITFYNSYKKDLGNKLSELSNNDLELLKQDIINTSKKKGSVYLLGNGGSISTANHISLDLLKNAKINSKNLYNDNLITCFANDYGHDNWMKEAIKHYGDNGDLLIAISSSGKSKNIINACFEAKKKNLNQSLL